MAVKFDKAPSLKQGLTKMIGMKEMQKAKAERADLTKRLNDVDAALGALLICLHSSADFESFKKSTRPIFDDLAETFRNGENDE